MRVVRNHVLGQFDTPAVGVLMRTLQEWMGHRDIATTQRYADYTPNEREVEMLDRAFGDPGA